MSDPIMSSLPETGTGIDALIPTPYDIRRVKPVGVWMVRRPPATPLGNSVEVTAQDDMDLRRRITIGPVAGGQGARLEFDKLQIPELIAALTAAYRWKDDGEVID